MPMSAATIYAQEIWEHRHPYGELETAQDVKWYVAEADLDERTADEVTRLLMIRLDA